MSFLSHHQLTFDASDLTNSDQVASYLYAPDGTALTVTGTALDVNIDNASIVVTATDLDIRDLSASQDNVAISDGTDTLAVNADGSINSVVTATDLDVRDLINTQDSIAIGDETNLVDLQQNDAVFGTTAYGFAMFGVRQDASGSPVSADGDAHPLVFNDNGELKVSASLISDVADDAADAGNPIKVGSRAVDGLLTAVSASDDRADLLSDLYRRVWVNDAPNVGVTLTKPTVSATAAELAATPQAGRKRILVQNLSDKPIYVGPDNTVTSSTGIEIPKKGALELPWGEDLDVWAISAGAIVSDVRVLEVA